MQADGSELTASVSIGIAFFPDDGHDFETLVGSAQVAMHKSKERGGNQRQFYRADMSQSTIARIALVAALRNAIRLNQLALHYQPFADTQTGRIGGMEALLRWTHPELGRVSPATFIPMAEQSGLIIEIGYWMLHPETIRVVLSGHTDLQAVTDAISEGVVYRFMAKPWDDDQLRAFIAQAFRHRELDDENAQLNIQIRTTNHELAESNRKLQEALAQKQRDRAQDQRNPDVVRKAL